MNVFELAIVAAPLSGCIAAAKVASSQSPAVIAGCAVVGLVVGAAAFFGPVLGSTWLFSRVCNPAAPPDKPGVVEWLVGASIVLCAALSPVFAWFSAAYAVSYLF